MVFLVGPGNYLEYLSLKQASAQGGGVGGGRKIIYGCTEVLTASEFLSQTATLGGKAA